MVVDYIKLENDESCNQDDEGYEFYSDEESCLPVAIKITLCKDCMHHETLHCFTHKWTSMNFYCQYGDKKSDSIIDNVYINFQEILKLPRNTTYNLDHEVVEETINLKDIVSLLDYAEI